MISFLSVIHNKYKSMQFSLLDQVTASIVFQMENVGVYHYNKLTYLTEYLFIRNFGKRLTNEKFIKLPHGPVISDYRKQIAALYSKSIINVNIEELNKTRKLNDDLIQSKIQISKTENTFKALPDEVLINNFIHGVVEKYGKYSIAELEQIVYSTEPVIRYKESRFKKITGGYILDGECIRIKDHKNSIADGRRIALDHLKKYPIINRDQQIELQKEFSPLKELRPMHES